MIPGFAHVLIIAIPVAAACLVASIVKHCHHRSVCQWSSFLLYRRLFQQYDATLGELLFLVTIVSFPLVGRLLIFLEQYPSWSIGYQNSGVGNAFFRSMGELNFVTLGFVLFPVSQNSLFVSLLGISFERALAWHRLWGRLALIVMLVHGAGMWVLFGQSSGSVSPMLTAENEPERLFPFRLGNRTETFEFVLRMARNPTTTWSNLSGFLAFVCFGLMGITSLNWFRRNHFELFYFAHISLAVPGFVFAFLHMPALARYLAPALLLYLLDLAFRYYRGTRLPSRLLIMKAFSEARVTALTISKQASSSDVPFEYLPGQYVFLQCPFLSKLENHPFSISSPPELKSGPASCTESIFTLHIRDMGPGTFSNQLLALALQRQTESRGQSLDASSATLSRSSLPNVTTSEATGSESVTIDGPYGSPAVELGDYDTLILVCGGIGITPALSWLAFLASSGPHDYQNDKAVVSQSSFCRKVFAWASSGMTDIPSRLQQILATNRRVALLWSIPDLSLVPVFASQLKAVHEYIERHQHQYRHVSMSIHVTRVPDLDSELKQNDAIPSQLHPYLVKQRPNHSVAFQSFQSVGNQQCASACVFACGPEALVNESRAAADAFGYDFHSEVFLF